MASHDAESLPVLQLRVPATEEGMDAVHEALAGCWSTLQQTQTLDGRWRAEFSLAVAEVAANIIQHAHAPESPFVHFSLSLTRYPGRLVASFIDRGIVATPPELATMPSVDMPYEDLGERGRGLALVQATTDRFEYRRTLNGENIWLIEKDYPQ
jgi:serine/threonine-protein kinase RsbW